MLLPRVLGAIGRTFITLGVMTLLFVAYQLWGTGILTAQAQAALEDDFSELLDEAGVLDREVELPTSPTERANVREAAETAEEKATKLKFANLLWQPEGNAIAQLLMPTIDVDKTIVSGVGTDSLRDGPGHYPGTPLPGMPGNSAIAGHRTTWGAPFHRIDELQPGDEITVRTLQGTFVYRVVEQQNGKGHFIVSPDRVDVLDQDFDDHPNRLTLTACHPKYTARQRIIVVAELVGEPVEFIARPDSQGIPEVTLASENISSQNPPTEEALRGDPDLPTDPLVDPVTEPPVATEDDSAIVVGASSQPGAIPLQGLDAPEDFGAGLNGDDDAILPAIMWGLAAAAIWVAARVVAERWKPIPTYVIGLVPFAIVLFVCFMHIDKAIPSY